MAIFTGNTPIYGQPPALSQITTDGVVYHILASGTQKLGKLVAVEGNRSRYPGFNFDCQFSIVLSAFLGIYSLTIFSSSDTEIIALGWSTADPVEYEIEALLAENGEWTITFDLISGTEAYTGGYVVPATPLSSTPVGCAYSQISIQADTGFPPLTSCSWSYWTTGPNPLLRPPEAPVLWTPVDNATNVPLNSLLKWYASARAEYYHLQLDTEASFTGAMTINQDNLVDLFVNSSGRLELATHYFWRVHAQNQAGISDWSAVWEFDTVVSVDDSQDCPYVDNVWTFNAVIKTDLGGGSYKIWAGTQKDITAFLCSNDTLGSKTFAVALRTKEGEWYLTTCSRINYGKLYRQHECKDLYCKLLHLLFCGDDCSTGSGNLGKVSTGYVVSSTTTSAVVKTGIGVLTMLNDYGSPLPVNKKCVIFSPDQKNNFTKMLGPAE